MKDPGGRIGQGVMSRLMIWRKMCKRYLDDEPVEACSAINGIPAGQVSIGGNKVALATTATAVCVLSLILGLAGTTWQSIRANTGVARRKPRAKKPCPMNDYWEVDEQKRSSRETLPEGNGGRRRDAHPGGPTRDLADIPRMGARSSCPSRKSIGVSIKGSLKRRVKTRKYNGRQPERKKRAGRTS